MPNPELTPSGPRGRILNPPPGAVPAYFQGRQAEAQRIANFLRDEAARLLWIVGPAGVGKTTLAGRTLHPLRRGRLPDDLGTLDVDGIIYLSASGTRRITFPTLYADLCRLLPAATARDLETLYRTPQVSAAARVQSLLAAFPSGRVVLLLDGFEDALDATTGDIADAELDEMLHVVLARPGHGLKMIVTTRALPHGLTAIAPERQRWIDLAGLDAPATAAMLRDLDVDGTLGLQSAPPTLLDAAWQRTHGNPRALEALWAILASDPDASPTALLDAIASPAAEKVAEIWAGEVYRRIDAAAQRVMQGLAIYGRPMTPTAVAYLWQLSPSELRSAPISKRLVTLRLVRKEGTRYYLHAADRQAALAQVALTQPLYQRAADYFRQARKPREEWKMLDDLAPQLAEFELRCAAEEFDAAAEVITSIDLDYLMLWGHYRLVAECHDRLRGRLSDRGLQAASLTTLGNAYIDMGAARNAVIAYEQALSIDRTEGDRLGEASDLGNLGVAYRRLGDLRQAIDYYEQALAMTRAAGDRRGEANFLGNLGITYAAMGETRRAIGYYEQALAIARATGDRREETRRLGNLGLAHADLGETAQAIAWHEQALAITRATGDRWGEAVHLGNLAEEMVDAGRYAEAASLALESVRIGEEIGTPGSYSHGQLALAYLHTGDLPAARAAAEVACRYQEPRHNHNVLALLGVIARRQGDDATARAAFGTAVAHAEAMLAYDPRNYDALDAKGLALSGLASLATGEQRQVNTSAAAAAYRAARAFNQDPGIVGRVLRLLDALALADRDSPAFLIPIRAAAGA